MNNSRHDFANRLLGRTQDPAYRRAPFPFKPETAKISRPAPPRGKPPAGTVQIDADFCDKCGAYEAACPYGAITHAEQHGPVKCTLCFSRRENGWLPSCAQHCEGRAFTITTEKEILSVIKEKKYTCSTGQVIYVSDKWAGLGKALPADSV